MKCLDHCFVLIDRFWTIFPNSKCEFNLKQLMVLQSDRSKSMNETPLLLYCKLNCCDATSNRHRVTVQTSVCFVITPCCSELKSFRWNLHLGLADTLSDAARDAASSSKMATGFLIRLHLIAAHFTGLLSLLVVCAKRNTNV